MKIYNIYTKTGKDDVYVRDKFSIWSLFLGPFMFLFYKMWHEFALYMTILISGSYIYVSGIVTAETLSLINITMHIILAFDFTNLYQRFLTRHGYKYSQTIYPELGVRL